MITVSAAARNLANTTLLGLYGAFLYNAAWNVYNNFTDDDVSIAPIYFNLARAAVVTFSFFSGQICRLVGPLSKANADIEGQMVIAVISGIAYGIITLVGAIAEGTEWDAVRDTDSFHYMQKSFRVPADLIFKGAFVYEALATIRGVLVTVVDPNVKPKKT